LRNNLRTPIGLFLRNGERVLGQTLPAIVLTYLTVIISLQIVTKGCFEKC